MSLYSYIHEYDAYDAVMLEAHNTMKECALMMFEYEQASDIATKKVMFENADYDVYMEDVKENIFVKIGKAITALIKKAADFIKDTFDKFLNRNKNKEREKNVALAKQFLAAHPDQRDTIIEALDKGDIELKDLAAYSRDVESVLKLAERQEGDADTLNNKVNDVCDKIERSAVINVGKTLGTIGAAVGGVFIIYKALGEGTGIVKDIKDTMDRAKDLTKDSAELRRDINKYNRSSTDPSTRDSAILKDRIQRKTEDLYNDRVRYANSRVNAFSKLLSTVCPEVRKLGAVLKKTDASIERYAQKVAGDNFDANQNP